MPRSLAPGPTETDPSCAAIAPEPDVPWGKGGIDDYGWTSWEGDPPASPAPESAEGPNRA